LQLDKLQFTARVFDRVHLDMAELRTLLTSIFDPTQAELKMSDLSAID
jgi:hypothetical protein